MVPMLGMGGSMRGSQHCLDETQDERDHVRRPSSRYGGAGERYRRDRRSVGRALDDSDEDERYRQQRSCRDRDMRERESRDIGGRGGDGEDAHSRGDWSRRPDRWTPPPTRDCDTAAAAAVAAAASASARRVWDLQPASALEQQLQLQQQVAAAAAAAAVVSQPQLLLPAQLQLPQQLLLGSAAAAVDHMTLVNMNLAAAAALQQQQQHQQHSAAAAAAAVVAAAAADAQQQQQQQPANNTVMVRALPSHITENDLREEIVSCNLVPKDIRLIRRKDSGASRGFAFIEFSTVQEAARWMDLKQGVLLLQDRYRAIVQYSAARDAGPHQSTYGGRLLADWTCPQCSGHNFKRRDSCYKCQCRRPVDIDPDGSGACSSSSLTEDGADEVSGHPTNTLLVRQLPADCSEEQLLTALQPRTQQLPIRSVRLARHAGTGASLRRCYLQLNSVLDAMQLSKQLTDEPLTMAGQTLLVSYCRLADGGGAATAVTSAAGGADAAVDTSRMSIQEMAEYSAKMYAKTPDEYQSYLQYYTDYYKTHGTAGVSVSDNQSDSANAAAAVAHTALQRVLKKTPASQQQQLATTAAADNSSGESSAASSSSGAASATTTAASVVFDENAVYPAPDTSTFQYDEASGYYYDASTGLYYDSSSQYFYNGHTQCYLYWHGEQQRYVPASGSQQDEQQLATAGADDKKTKKEDKHEKVKVAKKIAKDMERWAKTMNSKKESSQGRAAAVTPAAAAAQPVLPVEEAHRAERQVRGAADIGYSMFGRRGGDAAPPASSKTAAAGASSSLVAAYGGESGDEEDHSSNNNTNNNNSGVDATASDSVHVDLNKLACLLCKRAFASREQLNKHLTKSQLHRTNLAALQAGGGTAPAAGGGAEMQYRDRAAERRHKHGDTAPAAPPRRQPPPQQQQRPQSAAAMPVSGVGSRMMQCMGWKDGQGLGRDNQGRTAIVQAGRRAAGAGLGVTGGDMGGAVAGDTYRDCVNKSMAARFNHIQNNGAS